MRTASYIPLLNIGKRVLLYCDLTGVGWENIEPYLAASVSLPIFNTGVNIDGTIYFDGAMVDNIPVYPLIDRELDYIILLYFDNRDIVLENAQFDSKIIKLNFPDSSLRSSLTLTREEILKTMTSGYWHAKNVLEYIFKNEIENTKDVRDRISTYNLEFPARKVILSGDVFVRQMNKAVKRFIRAKITNEERSDETADCGRVISAARSNTNIQSK